MLQRLHLNIGDQIQIGDTSFVITAELASEPDRIIRFTTFGPRVLVRSEALQQTGLLVEGSLIKYIYKVRLKERASADKIINILNKKFPSVGWRIRTTDNAVPGFDRFTTLIIGGLGIGNSARNYLEQRVSSIATLKCLGGDDKLVFQIYFTQMLVVGICCILVGITVGALIPAATSDLILKVIPIALPSTIFYKPLILGFVYGFLITFIFTLLPLAKTTRIKPGYLFRSSTTRDMSNTPSKFLIWVIGAFLCLALISILNNNDQRLTFFFVIGVAVLFCMLLFGSYVTKFLCFKLTHIQLSFFRLVLSNIIRPGNLTTGIILSLG